MFRKFLRAQFPKPLYRVGTDDVENYHAALIKGNTVSSSYINQSINAIKFYLEQVLGLARQHYALTRPVRSKQLPRVLSQGEIAKLLGTLRNVKHRAMLTLIYSSGLRISELINMKIEDVDSQNMRLWVRNAKGRKDRINAAGPTHFTAAAAILQGLRA
jgi:site-specific recombinase XerD